MRLIRREKKLKARLPSEGFSCYCVLGWLAALSPASNMRIEFNSVAVPADFESTKSTPDAFAKPL